MIEKFVDTMTVVIGLIVIICGILAIIYIVSPEFERKVHNTAAQIGAGNKRGEQ